MLQYRIWHFLSDTDAWFAINPAIHSIRCYWRDKPEFSSGDDFDTGDSKHKVWFRFMESQYTDWRGIDGSQGA